MPIAVTLARIGSSSVLPEQNRNRNHMPIGNIYIEPGENQQSTQQTTATMPNIEPETVNPQTNSVSEGTSSCSCTDSFKNCWQTCLSSLDTLVIKCFPSIRFQSGDPLARKYYRLGIIFLIISIILTIATLVFQMISFIVWNILWIWFDIIMIFLCFWTASLGSRNLRMARYLHHRYMLGYNNANFAERGNRNVGGQIEEVPPERLDPLPGYNDLYPTNFAYSGDEINLDRQRFEKPEFVEEKEIELPNYYESSMSSPVDRSANP